MSRLGLTLRVEIVDRIDDAYTPHSKRLAYIHTIDGLTFEDIAPLRRNLHPMTPYQICEEYQRADRRRRVVDMVAGKIAHALTEGIIKGPPQK